MANETEVEVPVEGASASAGTETAGEHIDSHAEDISGVDNLLEEGGPLEPPGHRRGRGRADPVGGRPAGRAGPPISSACRPSSSTTSAVSIVTGP
ncbi:hypothetical protein [Nocardioides sp. B-3]|uniref:hypothetical protein n=1 Tax=Nocardioides sp. B-3 TaxID=2895565 RepID=UPI002153248E|nr:hypothetical protein [Nocardioides sp. B-3]UUZ61954.1 hypothetical protein LP418_13260 [Nocardioides sp. B-3]